MRRHFSFANVVSSMALFFALCGGSYAAVSDDAPPAAAPTVAPAGTVPASEVSSADPSSVAPVEVTDSPAAIPAAPPVAPSGEADAPVAPAQPTLPAAAESAGPPEHAVAAIAGDEADVESDDAAGGPPPWAPAYGYRCQQEAAPGSDAFHACIESSKP